MTHDLDNVTVLGMRVCAARFDASVTGEEFIALVQQLVSAAVREYEATRATEADENLPNLPPGRGAEVPAASTSGPRSQQGDAVGPGDETVDEEIARLMTATPDQPIPQPVKPNGMLDEASDEPASDTAAERRAAQRAGGYGPKLSYDDRTRIRTRYQAALDEQLALGRGRVPRGLVAQLAAEFGCSDATVISIGRNKDSF